MKKLISLITLLAIMSQFAFSVSAAEGVAPYYTDNFADYNVGDDYSGTGGVCSVRNDGDGNYIYFNGANYGDREFAQVGYYGAAITNDVITIKFDYKLESGYTDGAHFYCGSTVNMELDTTPSGYHNVVENGVTKTTSYGATGTISSGSWHEITTVINITNQNFCFYVDGARIVTDGPFRYPVGSRVNNVSYVNFFMNNSNYKNKKFAVGNLRVYKADLTPTTTNDFAEARAMKAEKPLTDITKSNEYVKEAIPEAFAMAEGYTYGYSAGVYENVSSDEYLAPVWYDNTLFAPASYVAKALGGSYSEGTITAGEKSFAFAEGVTSELCDKAPVMVADELYIPVTDTLTKYFGKNTYIDDRGVAIIGISDTPGEQVIRSLLFELRNYSAIFGKGVKSEILFCSRSWYGYNADRKGGYDSIDATKRFMSTSNRWTYHATEYALHRFRDAGSLVQSGLNAVPVKVKTDENGNQMKCNHTTGCTQAWHEAASMEFDGRVRVRSDGLHGWGCTSNPQFLADLIGKAQAGIDIGQYLWQFDDFPLNSPYGCYCDYCMEGFTKWLKEEKGCTTYRDLYTKYGAGDIANITSTVHNTLNYTEYFINGGKTQVDTPWITYVPVEGSKWVLVTIKYVKEVKKQEKEVLNTSIDEFNYKEYLRDVEGLTTNSQVFALYSGDIRLGKAFKEYSTARTYQFHQELRAAMDEYAATKGLKIFMTHNTSSTPAHMKNAVGYYEIMDGGMGETNPQDTGSLGIFVTKLGEQAFGESYVNSLWVRQGKTTMQLWESAVPLMYATGQYGLMPWDDWVYNSTRYYCTPEELAGNYTFVREHSDLFDNYESPEEVGYIMDMDVGVGLNDTQLREFAQALSRKGIAWKVIGQRSASAKHLTLEASDFKGIKTLVNVQNTALTDAENAVVSATGLTTEDYTWSADNQMTYLDSEKDYWTARVKDMPADVFAVLRKNTIYKNAPVVVHAVNFDTVNKKNLEIEINNKYLPEGDNFEIKFHSPWSNTYSKTVAKDGSGITTVIIDELNNWMLMEISGSNTLPSKRFDVDGMQGIGLGSRVSYDKAEGTEKDFTITTWGEGINTYSYTDQGAGQDEAGYVYKYITDDDFEVTAQVDAINGEAGLMVREDLYSNAASIILSYSSEKGIRLGKRDMTNMAMTFKEYEGEAPSFVKLSFKNNIATAYISEDGDEWIALGSYEAFFKPATAGVFATSADGSKAECNVRGFALTETGSELENEILSTNLMEGRNPSFLNSLLMDYSCGFDGVWKSDYASKTEYPSNNETATVVDRASTSVDSVGLSAKLTGRSNGEEGLWYRYLPVENGKTYEISCYAKVDAGVSDTGSIVVQTPKRDSRYSRNYTGTTTFEVDYDGSAALSEEWTKVYKRFTVSETGIAAGIDIRFATNTNCDLYLDNFELREVKSIGENLNAVMMDYHTHAVFELSTKDGSAKNIRYTAVIKKPDEFGNLRTSSIDTKVIEVTGATTRIDVAIKELGGYAEILLWDADLNAPVNRTFKIRRTR